MTEHLPGEVRDFLKSKPAKAAELFLYFYSCYQDIQKTDVEVTKTTVAFGKNARQCYIYQFGKDFIGGVLRLNCLYDEPALFFKARAVSSKSFAHHFRLYEKEDLSPGLLEYIKKATGQD